MTTDASALEIIRTQSQVISICFQAGSLVISFITLILAIKAFGKYVSNRASEKQLDAVIDLVEELENLTFLIGVRNREYIGEGEYINNNQVVARLNVFWASPSNYKLNREVDVLFSKEAVSIFSAIHELSKNILLPPSIAESLRRLSHFEGLNIWHEKGKKLFLKDNRPSLETAQELEKRNLIKYPFLYIFSGREYYEYSPNLLYSFIPDSYDLYRTTGFFKVLNEISKSILEWLKKFNIEEINIKRHPSEKYIALLEYLNQAMMATDPDH